MKNIDLIVGARPNFIKAFPVYEALHNSGDYKLRLINTGQHYDENMSNIFFHQLQMKPPDINLMISSGSHAEQTGKIMIAIEKVFIDNKPDLVMVFGDVNSTIASALAASKLQIPVAHAEAGLRSFDRTMPEEINRVLTDQISDLLFITSPEAKDNLINEGKTEHQIFFVGNTMIDTLVRFEERFDGNNILKKYNLQKNEFILVTIHRPSNVDNINQFKKLILTLNELADKFTLVWPVHPRTKKVISQNSIKLNNKIIFMDPVGYLEFMGFQKNAKIIITDSGGVQEEATYFGVPCLTVRENTERPITITEGTNILIGTDFRNIFDSISNIQLTKKKDFKKPKYWDGKASLRILAFINNYFGSN
jgi:UDP-N-acetylglucosamine 2-epimerase (non-hydrolysing)